MMFALGLPSNSRRIILGQDCEMDSNKSILIFAPTLEDMKLRLSQGYDAVAVTTVTNTIRRGYEQILKII